jgi:hypothetical protein
MSTTFENNFNRFLSELSKCPYDLPSELNSHFRTALLAAGFDNMNSSGLTGVGLTTTVATKTRKLSGYNVYMKEKMAELKVEGIAAGDRMGKVSSMWGQLSAEDKAQWKAKADNLNPNVSTTGTTHSAHKVKREGPPKLSGYQLFVKETMGEVKADTSIPAKERMTKIGSLWKALTPSDQETFKKKAEEVNAQAQAQAQAQVQDQAQAQVQVKDQV